MPGRQGRVSGVHAERNWNAMPRAWTSVLTSAKRSGWRGARIIQKRGKSRTSCSNASRRNWSSPGIVLPATMTASAADAPILERSSSTIGAGARKRGKFQVSRFADRGDRSADGFVTNSVGAALHKNSVRPAEYLAPEVPCGPIARKGSLGNPSVHNHQTSSRPLALAEKIWPQLGFEDHHRARLNSAEKASASETEVAREDKKTGSRVGSRSRAAFQPVAVDEVITMRTFAMRFRNSVTSAAAAFTSPRETA